MHRGTVHRYRIRNSVGNDDETTSTLNWFHDDHIFSWQILNKNQRTVLATDML